MRAKLLFVCTNRGLFSLEISESIAKNGMAGNVLLQMGVFIFSFLIVN